MADTPDNAPREKVDSDLEAFLSTLSPVMQKRALRALNEWGVSTAEEDNFPVKLALITRLNLWALAKSGLTLVAERQAIAELVTGISLALSSEAETRETFLRQFAAEERGEAQRIHSLARHIEQLQESFLRSVKELAQALPDPAAFAQLLKPRASPDQEEFRQAAAKLIRAARRLDERTAAVHPVAIASVAATSPTAEPAISEPLVVQVPVPVLARPLAFAVMFLSGFSYAWVLHPGSPVSVALVVTCALPAAVLTVFFLVCLVLYPR